MPRRREPPDTVCAGRPVIPRHPAGTLCVCCSRYRRGAQYCAQRVAPKIPSISLVNHLVQDRIGHRCVGEETVPLGDRDLTGEDRHRLAGIYRNGWRIGPGIRIWE